MTSVDSIKRELEHPVVDADGHVIEFLPVLEDMLRDVAGAGVAARFHRGTVDAPPDIASLDITERRLERRQPPASWVFPSRHTLDRATAMLPALAYSRLDEMGIDFALAYPTFGLGVFSIRDEELRCALARACNTYYAQVFDGYRDRLEPVAAIPTFTPEEAIAELDYAVGVLGLKAVTMGGVVPRFATRPDGSKVQWLDHLGHESTFNYDAVWQRCDDLGVVPTFHAKGAGWGSRTSTTNYVYNHLGDFAAAQEAACRSLLMGGAPRRFPEMRWAFLEGGVAWACQLYADVVSHYEKRNRESVRNYDPTELDVGEFRRLLQQYATGPLRYEIDRIDQALASAMDSADGRVPDDFAESQINAAAEITDIFSRQFFFGCEADDPLVAVAFDRRLNPGAARLRPLFASDIGHWDVPDMSQVLLEAWELVEHGHLDREQFAEFSCGNTIDMLTANNPRFFDGTVIEDFARRALAARSDA